MSVDVVRINPSARAQFLQKMQYTHEKGQRAFYRVFLPSFLFGFGAGLGLGFGLYYGAPSLNGNTSAALGLVLGVGTLGGSYYLLNRFIHLPQERKIFKYLFPNDEFKT